MNFFPKGFSLIEVMVILAVMSVGSLAMLTLQRQQMQSNNYLQFQLKRSEIERLLASRLLDDPIQCGCLFKNASPQPLPIMAKGATLKVKNPPTTIGRFDFKTPGDCETATIVQPLASGDLDVDGVKVKSIQLQDVSLVGGRYSGDLVVQLQSTRSVLGPSELPIRIPVDVAVVPLSGGSVGFEGCSIGEPPNSDGNSSLGSGGSGRDGTDGADILKMSCGWTKAVSEGELASFLKTLQPEPPSTVLGLAGRKTQDVVMCKPPGCPDGYTSLGISNEVTALGRYQEVAADGTAGPDGLLVAGLSYDTCVRPGKKVSYLKTCAWLDAAAGGAESDPGDMREYCTPHYCDYMGAPAANNRYQKPEEVSVQLNGVVYLNQATDHLVRGGSISRVCIPK